MLVGGRLLIFSEADLPHELLDDQTLATRGQYDFGGIQGPVTAHGRFDPDNGDLLFYGVAANINCEFPRHNDRLVGKPVRYGYYAATRRPGFCSNWI